MSKYGEEIRSTQKKSGQLHRFWAQRDSANMDSVYASLLRAGSSSTKRHYELTGALADAEMAQNAEAAKLNASLLRAVAVNDAAAPAVATPLPVALEPRRREAVADGSGASQEKQQDVAAAQLAKASP